MKYTYQAKLYMLLYLNSLYTYVVLSKCKVSVKIVSFRFKSKINHDTNLHLEIDCSVLVIHVEKYC